MILIKSREAILNTLIHADYCDKGEMMVRLRLNFLTVFNSRVFRILVELAV